MIAATLSSFEPWLLRSCRLTDPGVYFLCDNSNIVYVGQGKFAGQRAMSHFYKKWDEVFVLPCGVEHLKSVEAAFISLLKPHYNKTKHRSGHEILHHASLLGFSSPEAVLTDFRQQKEAA